MSSLQCPKCGKPSTGLCPECYIHSHPLQVVPEKYRECVCGKIFFKGQWYDYKHDMMSLLAQKSIKPPSEAEIKVKDVEYEEVAGKMRIKAFIEGRVGRNNFTKEISWEITPEKVKCESCRKQNSGYYEAVLQLRDPKLHLDLDEKQIAGIEKVRGGYDIQIISGPYSQGIANKLIESGYIVKHSSSLYGKKNGKDVSRFYYSIKHAPFYVGDFIEYKERLTRVRELGKMMKLQDIKSGKILSASSHHLEDAKVIVKSSEVGQAIITEIRPDGMQILDEKKYKTHYMPTADGLKQGDTVEYIKVRGKIHILLKPEEVEKPTLFFSKER